MPNPRNKKVEHPSPRHGKLLNTLGNPKRWLILKKLQQGEHSVGDLAGWMEKSSSTISNCLRSLKTDGLVVSKTSGHKVIYSLHPNVKPYFAEFADALDALLKATKMARYNE